MRRGWKFFRHWWRAKTRHGTHSPFVYALVEDGLYAPVPPIDQKVRAYFKQLRTSTEEVKGEDHGRGGEIANYRLGDLARRSAAKDFESELLARLAQYHQARHFLELGTNLGKTSAFVAQSSPDCQVTGVEGNAGLAQFSNKAFADLQLANAKCLHSTFSELFTSNKEQFDLVFIDGDHRYEPTLENYERAKRCLRGEGPIVLHDIYWSEDMGRAWEKIKADQDATVTIDLFFFGLVYFRPGQVKEHFQIRYPKSLTSILP